MDFDPQIYEPQKRGSLLALKKTATPLKLNMEPENQPLEKGDSYWKTSFSGSMSDFGGGT